MARCFCLGEIEDAFEVGDAHLAVGHNEVEDAQAGGVGAGEEDLGAQVDVKMF